MEKIASFQVDHTKLFPGVYVSRKDHVGEEVVTTFDLRMKRPNMEPVLNTAELHALEHLGATFLRNDPEWKDKTIYFGPMGCRTGFYVVFAGDLESADVLDVIIRLFRFARDYEGVIPGQSPVECGNYLDLNLPMAKYEAAGYLELLEQLPAERMVYPE